MKCYMFIRGVDGFGEDSEPAPEIGVYLDFDKAFKKLIELNHEGVKNGTWYEDGWGIDYYPHDNEEVMKAVEKAVKTDDLKDWEIVDNIVEKHRIYDDAEVNKLIIDTFDYPPFNMYSIEESEIIE